MTEELKPCPFCGSKVEIMEDELGRYGIAHINKFCSLEKASYSDNREKFIEAWNTHYKDETDRGVRND